MVTNQEKMEIAMKAWALIFESKAANSDISQVELVHPAIMGGRCRGRWFKNSVTGQATLRGFDIPVGRVANEIIHVRILEQNPDKGSEYAKMARAGSKIAWIINQNIDQFTGRIQDGKFYPARNPAYTPVQPTAPAPSTQSTPQPAQMNQSAMAHTAIMDSLINEDQLPEVDEAGIPEFVLNYFGGLDDGLD